MGLLLVKLLNIYWGLEGICGIREFLVLYVVGNLVILEFLRELNFCVLLVIMGES